MNKKRNDCKYTKPISCNVSATKIQLRLNLVCGPNGMTCPIGVKPDGSKADRMVAQSAKIEAGHVHLPKQADWLDSFLLELLAFPHGRHDDQVDSVSQFLKWAAARKLYAQPVSP